ncbi:MAG: hypothetical protein K0Q95_3306 [Bacteroidota bacterium]|jgi:hypothetical protein|nr:hypothetical protein [Bacteroidota bacterium]
MNKINQLRTTCYILLTFFAISCSNKNEHNALLNANGINETDRIPNDYSSAAWKPLTAGYVYYMDVFDINHTKQLLYILANKKEEKLVGIYHVNDHLMPATYARGVNPPTIVTNFEEISEADIERSDNMDELNALFKSIPEMKNFSWKNEVQNTIASATIMKTHFVFIVSDKVDDTLFAYADKPVKLDHDKLVQQIFASKFSIFNRPVQRLNENVEMGHFIKDLGFKFDNPTSVQALNDNKFYINDLLVDEDSINFKGTGKLFLFFPFKSYTRVLNKGETPMYGPAVATFEYSFSPDAEGFPVFKRTSHRVSLLRSNKIIN